MAQRWNANLHAFDALLRRVPASARTGLDVGCGEGETARRLRAVVPSVVGLDPDGPSIERARTYGDDITYVCGDVFDADLRPSTFDVVTSVAMLHHIPHEDGLRRLGELVSPGGTLLVVGLSFSRTAADHLLDVRDAIAIRRYTLTRRQWHTTAPIVWPPPHSYDEVRILSAQVLPGCLVERVPYFRYTITWTRPSADDETGE